MIPKKGKEKKQFLRKVRNGKLVDPPKVYARRYMAVPTAEIRKGEEVRMPAGGQVRRPADKRGRKIFDEFGGAADHLLRMPRGPFLGSQKILRERGNLISMPAGRKNPLIVTYSEIPADAVANRRVGRWTQPDPLGKRGQARHRGGASRGAEGSMAVPSEQPTPHSEEAVAQQPVPGWGQATTGSAQYGAQTRDAANVKNVEDNIRNAGRGMPEPATASAMRQKQQEEDALMQKYGGNRFIHRDSGQLDLREITVDDVVSIMPMMLDDDGNKARRGTLGAYETFRVKLTDGSTILYKQVAGEAEAETFTTTVDRILGLNITAGTAHNVLGMQAVFGKMGGLTDSKELEDLIFKAHESMTKNNNYGKSFDQWERELRMGGRQGVGHVMEFCQPDCVEFQDASSSQINNLVQDFDKRQGIHKIALLDFITGNRDRHPGNFMINNDNELVAIDNGFAGGTNPVTSNYDRTSIGKYVKGQMLHEAGPQYGNAPNVINPRSIIQQGGGNRNTAKVEAMDIFDAQFTQETLDDILAAGQLSGITAKFRNLDTIRANFEKHVDRIY